MIITGIIKLFIMFLTLSLYTIIGLVIFMVTQLILYRVFKFNLYKKINKILWKEWEKIVILNIIITDEEYKTTIRITSNEMDATEEEKDQLDYIKKTLKVNLKANNFNKEK